MTQVFTPASECEKWTSVKKVYVFRKKVKWPDPRKPPKIGRKEKRKHGFFLLSSMFPERGGRRDYRTWLCSPVIKWCAKWSVCLWKNFGENHTWLQQYSRPTQTAFSLWRIKIIVRCRQWRSCHATSFSFIVKVRKIYLILKFYQIVCNYNTTDYIDSTSTMYKCKFAVCTRCLLTHKDTYLVVNICHECGKTTFLISKSRWRLNSSRIILKIFWF